MSTVDLNSIAKELENSPLFQLSLASKELFHSNFLFWLWNFDASTFKVIIEKLCKTSLNWPADCVVEREYEQFDLSVWDKDKRLPLLILENKVKSLPRKNQLDEYKNKIKHNNETKFLLLSLCTNFSEKEEIKQSGWFISNYDELVSAIKQSFDKKDFDVYTYQHNLIQDYCRFISHLHSMATTWNIDLSSSWLVIPDIDVYERLRIDDLRKKVHANQTLNLLIKKLKEDGKYSNFTFKWGVHVNDIFKDNGANVFYVNSGLTRSMGFFEIKVKIDSDTIFLIQVQGNQYRRAIERKGSLKDNILWLRDSQSPLHNFFTFDENSEPNYSYISPFDSESPFRPNSNKYQNGFCKFGDHFLYQYVTIAQSINVNNLISAILSDLTNASSQTKASSQTNASSLTNASSSVKK